MAQRRRTALICTVGTSLFDGNLARLSGDAPDAPERWEAIRSAYEKKRWADLAREMAQVDPTDRFCSAEINTIEEARKKDWLDLRHLAFLVSDTPKGKDTGALLKKYFEVRKGRDLPDFAGRRICRGRAVAGHGPEAFQDARLAQPHSPGRGVHRTLRRPGVHRDRRHRRLQGADRRGRRARTGVEHPGHVQTRTVPDNHRISPAAHCLRLHRARRQRRATGRFRAGLGVFLRRIGAATWTKNSVCC